MSNECDDNWYTLECICGLECPCRKNIYTTHLNAVRSYMKDGKRYRHVDLPSSPIGLGIDPPSEKLPERRTINVRGREEHEAVIKDAALCETLGLDQAYETMIYLKRWGGWLSDN